MLPLHFVSEIIRFLIKPWIIFLHNSHYNKSECFENRIKTPAEAKDLLKQIMVESIDYEVEDYSYPLILLVAGVNGVGKTTVLGTYLNIGNQRASGVRIVSIRPSCFVEPRVATLKL